MITSYFTKLTGTSFHQDDILKMRPGITRLRIIAQTDNEYDKYACEVQAMLKTGWIQIGWIPKGKNKRIHEELLAGRPVKIDLSEVTGGDDQTHGVNVGITYGKDDSVDLSKLEKQPVIFGDAPFVYFDEANHIAYDADGNTLISGSATEHFYDKEPDLTYAAKALAKRTGEKMEDILDAWQAKSKMAQDYGTVIHQAMELLVKYYSTMTHLDEATKREQTVNNWVSAVTGTAVAPALDVLKKNFSLGKDGITFHTEARIKYKNLTGIADLVIADEKKNFVLIDYKTNREIKEKTYGGHGKLTEYSLQQNHYRTIIEKSGYTCQGMFLLHIEKDKCTPIRIDNINIDKELGL